MTTMPEETLREGEELALEQETEEQEREKRRRRLLMLLLLLLLLLLFCVGILFCRYLQRPEPLPELLPVPADLNYPPHYLFSIYGMDKPVGVAVSPDGSRIYVTESGGERLIKVFSRDGEPISAFAPPNTRPGERSPVYVAVDATGRIYVSDRLQHTLNLYDPSGAFLDSLLGPELSLSAFVGQEIGELGEVARFSYNIFRKEVLVQLGEGPEQSIPGPEGALWSPLGIRIDASGALLVTDVVEARNAVYIYPAEITRARSWQNLQVTPFIFGETGQEAGQFLYPNSAVADSQGRIYVTDGNNGRISTWDPEGNFLFNFGRGGGDSSISLPRGAFIDGSDRLHVVDAVGQNAKVFDVSGPEPDFLFTFGDWGLDDGLFNYPNDIALDDTGRLYIADRENHRIQVWSY